jgi:hypothetical protein
MFSAHDWLAPLLLSLWQGRNIMEEGHDGGKLFISWHPGNKQGHNMPFKVTSPNDPLSSTKPHLPQFYHFPIIYLNFKSISG